MYRQERKSLSRLVFGCGATAQDDWRKWADAVYLAVCFTQRTQTCRVGDDIQAWAAGDARQIKMQRRLALGAIAANQTGEVWDRCHTAVSSGDTIGALAVACELPGLNCPKAAFVLQIMYGLAGCIDSRNVKEFSVQPPLVDKRNPATWRASCADYLALCERLGGSEFLWNNWCRGAAGTYDKWSRNPDRADDVSREHVDWVVDVRAALDALGL